MNFSNIAVLDFETGSSNPHRCQPLSLACVMIHGRNLTIMKEDIFYSLAKPIFDVDECQKYNLDSITDEALKVNKLQRKDLEQAPSLKVVWDRFCNFVDQYNYKNTKWTAPIKAGYNNTYFDNIIIDRIAGGHNRHLSLVSGDLKTNIKNTISAIKSDEEIKQTKQLKDLFRLSRKIFSNNEPYGFGPWDSEETLFHPRDEIDIMRLVWYWFENDRDVRSISFDSMREYFGMDSSQAHKADVDVLQSAELLVKFLKLERSLSTKVKFKDAFK